MSNADISNALGLLHQHAFQETRRLHLAGAIQGVQQGAAWTFWVVEPSDATPNSALTPAGSSEAYAAIEAPSMHLPGVLTPSQFELVAARVMSRHYGTPLKSHSGLGLIKAFDLVSADGRIVGDAKYYTLVGGQRLPPAKFSVIAEHVWLLEKTEAEHRFLVFGNERQVPVKWLARYGRLVDHAAFFFLYANGNLEHLQ